VNSYPPKAPFSKNHISASRGCSETDEDSDIILKALTRKILSALNKKICEIPSTTNKVIGAHVDIP